MTKSELIDALAKSTGFTKVDCNKFFESFVDTVTNTLKNGDEIRLIGFGTFKVTNRAAREARNPRTGDKIKIPATKAPKFTPGKDLKVAVS